MAPSNILNQEIKLPKLPRLPKIPNKYEVRVTRLLLVVYSVFALFYLINFWRILRMEDIRGVTQYILSPILIPLSLLLLFGIAQDIYAIIIIKYKRIKAWEHSLIGTIISTILLIFPAFAMLVTFENFYSPIISIIWIILTITLFVQISKLRKG